MRAKIIKFSPSFYLKIVSARITADRNANLICSTVIDEVRGVSKFSAGASPDLGPTKKSRRLGFAALQTKSVKFGAQKRNEQREYRLKKTNIKKYEVVGEKKGRKRDFP